MKRMGKVLKKTFKTYVLAIIIATFISIIIFSVYMSRVDKSSETFFNSMIAKTGHNMIKRGYDRYIVKSNEAHNEKLKEMKGSDITDDEMYKEFRCFVTELSDSINNNTEDMDKKAASSACSVFRYYDSEMNSLMQENTLMLVERESINDTKVRLYYTYQDESLTEQMENLRNKYGEKIGSVEFTVKDAYIKDLEFIPVEITYTSTNEDGSITETGEIYTTVRGEDLMKQDGYELYQIEDSFRIGESIGHTDSETFITYAAGLDEAKLKRVDKLLEESQKIGGNNDESVFITKKTGFLEKENFVINKLSDDEANTFYSVIYEKQGLIFRIFNYIVTENNGLIVTALLGVMILLVFAASIVGAAIYNGRKR